MKINTNLSSLIVQSNLKTSTNGLNTAIERMTTGFKINHAKDNAAGYSISTKLSSELSSYDVALDNASMGLDMLTTAQDSLDLITSHYQRMRDLAEQAANGTYGEDSLKAIQSEIDARKAEIERIVANTEYNGIKFFGNDDANGVDESKRVVNQTTFTKGETYFVTNSDDLVKLQDLVNSGVDTTDVTFELTSDINMTGINFRGIGSGGGDVGNLDETKCFKGDFKGNNHVISNLTINTTEYFAGLFGYVYGGSIDSVGLENCEVLGGTFVGGLAGRIDGGSITNSYVTGSVEGWMNVGGLAGCVYNGSITNSYATGSVTGDKYVGGLVGDVTDASITNSYATGSVTGSVSVGGLVGVAYFTPTLNGYYDSQKTGQTVGVGTGGYTGTVTGVTTAELEELIKNGTLPQYNYGGGTGGTGGGVFGGSYEVTLQVGIHSDKSSSITVDVGIGKIDLNIDVTTSDGARNALTMLDEYLKNINEKQTQLGSAYNRLESVIESIGVSIDNLTSTRSTIQDADIAEESSAYIRNQILQQASVTLLATANQTPAIALQLL
ncbi:MAG: flagellin [Candidatus Gastranaerophilaceae bacterium]